jgi:hypothetical protein
LAAEQEAARLVEALAQLKAEMESYRTSRTALDAAGVEMARLAGELTAIAQRVDGVVEALRAIGTPELLRAQVEARAEVAALRAELSKAQRAMGANVAARDLALDAVMDQVRSDTASAASALAGLRGLVLMVGGILLVGLVAVAVIVLLHGARV